MKTSYWLSLSSVLILAGCSGSQSQPCGPRNVSTRVVIGNIGTPSRNFEVRASGYTANAQGRLSIDNYPKRGEVRETVKFDASGSLVWTTFAPIMLSTDPDYEPDADVRTTLAEVDTQCFGLSSLKEREFGKIG